LHVFNLVLNVFQRRHDLLKGFRLYCNDFHRIQL
jgi:hypothetical protein